LRQVECVPRHPFSDYRGLPSYGADIRPALLRELTDLYVQKRSHTLEETRLFTELALRLIEHVDAAERARLGARLATYPGAPLAVIQRLAAPGDLLSSGQSEQLPAMQAQNLPRIEETRREETLSEAFFGALPAERRLILLHLDYSPIAPAPINRPAKTIVQLEQAAMTRQPDQFAAALAQILSISSACARCIAYDTTGEAVIAALKALAVPSPALQRILLFLNPAISQSSGMYFSLVQLYDQIGEDAARRLVAIWRMDDQSVARKGGHRAEFFDDLPAKARDFARHDGRPIAGHHASHETWRKEQTEK
jgi:uncharacterized protein (DUF2336 family)